MEISKKTIKQFFIGVAACLVLYWVLIETERVKIVLQVIKKVLSPFIFGSVLAFILNVPMRTIERILGKRMHPKLRRTIAITLTFLALLLILALVFWLLIPQVMDTAHKFIEQLPSFFESVKENIDILLTRYPEITSWLSANTNLANMDWSALLQKLMSVTGSGMSSLLSGTFSAIGNIANFAVNLVIGIVFCVYCIFQKELLARQGRRLLYAFLPEKISDYIVRILRMTNSTFSNFLSGQCIEVCILGAMFAISMAIFRMPYIPLVSVLVALTAFIPVVGAFVGCIIGAFFILVADPMQAVWFVVMFLVLQQIETNIIYPRVVGTSIGLPGMWVLLAVAVGGELMGVFGMFLMIPLAAVIYSMLHEVTHKRLVKRNIDPEKLIDHPPELHSKFRERIKKAGKKKIISEEEVDADLDTENPEE